MTTQNRPKIIALCAFRNEGWMLYDFLEHISDYVDEVILLNDNSDDGFDYARLLTIFRNTKIIQSDITGTEPHAREVQNREKLLREALKQKADFVLCCDADFRFEMNFLKNIKKIALNSVGKILSFQFRSLFNGDNKYRIDPPYDNSVRMLMFELFEFMNYHPAGSLHTVWMPPLTNDPVQPSGYNVYHLGDITREQREARFQKFLKIDPQNEHQSIGYKHITGCWLTPTEQIPAGREFICI